MNVKSKLRQFHRVKLASTSTSWRKNVAVACRQKWFVAKLTYNMDYTSGNFA